MNDRIKELMRKPVIELCERIMELEEENEKRNAYYASIAITQDDYNKIMSIFRVKGSRYVDGKLVPETRGRKSKNEEN